MRRRSVLSWLTIIGCLSVLVWRVPQIRREATHHAELSRWLNQPLPTVISGDVAHAGQDGVVYLYSEACPYCAIDHLMVRRAALDALGPSAAFSAISIGPLAKREEYWSDDGLPLPDTIVDLAPAMLDSLGITGVPVVVLLRGNAVAAAWIGKLRWNRTNLMHAMRCRLGHKAACIQLYMTEIGVGLWRRVRHSRQILTPVTRVEP